MRVLVTSDLHFDHGRSAALAQAAVTEINAQQFDVLLVVGDTATSRGTALEEGLSSFAHAGPKLTVLGNHELWSAATPDFDTGALYEKILPERIRALGWHLLDQGPVVIDGVGFAGNVGWYDYGFAPEYLRIPRRFYEAKVSPGSASYYTAHRHLLTPADDIPPESMEVYAKWNDVRHIRWDLTDEGFTELLLGRLEKHLQQVSGARHIVAAVHHLPLRELLPPRSTPAWDFAKAYLGSPRFGEVLSRYPSLHYVFSGHSHFPACCRLGETRYIATGSGYHHKHWQIVDL